MGERQSTWGAMILTFPMPSSSCLHDSSVMCVGLVVSGRLEAMQISLATRSETRLKSFCRNLARLRSLVALSMFISVPSSMPSGCGFISFVLGGICSVALSKAYLLPSGSMKVMHA